MAPESLEITGFSGVFVLSSYQFRTIFAITPPYSVMFSLPVKNLQKKKI